MVRTLSFYQKCSRCKPQNVTYARMIACGPGYVTYGVYRCRLTSINHRPCIDLNHVGVKRVAILVGKMLDAAIEKGLVEKYETSEFPAFMWR